MNDNEELKDLMSPSLLEIVELTSGDIVLRRVDGDKDKAGAPLVKIQFSEEAKVFLGEAKADIGKAMIGTGIQLVGRIYDQDILEERELQTLH
ncbi:MAG: hypothetical protein JKY67_12420 [Pseudomonadales bacterium]|nr:hypothetical protein [Pseudomonadales bacterium]